ncbi:LOG family protein [Saccharospirillum salsuginis]|uniref:Cytokinin riboside 5'-monophosphate phosphoribohydrolase n=1 Tax=Saccharospirillum salsuginis TaxID=418750 RepID=A0A918K6S6_9GAMM|nr:TIGR00730 family Rossman fold protein [Saccharospirillum salsuginis]GGX48510.1 cytokinin riboside 5'-monophosphate phosphoribohydrolase [Saccharospirillum salsuginis]
MTRHEDIAYQDLEFLESDAGRPLRILSEYLKPLAALNDAGIQDTVVFFGSARLSESGNQAHLYEAARTLANDLTHWSMNLPCQTRRFIVCSGGGGGIMEAANRGAAEAGGHSIGLNIGLPHEQHPNAFISDELGFEFRYFFMRKLWFAYLARAIVVFPGGFGTLDELFEILTLSQTRKLSRPIPVLLYDSHFWREVINFEALRRHGMISESDLNYFQMVDHPHQAFSALKTILTPLLDDTSSSLARSLCCDADKDMTSSVHSRGKSA